MAFTILNVPTVNFLRLKFSDKRDFQCCKELVFSLTGLPMHLPMPEGQGHGQDSLLKEPLKSSFGLSETPVGEKLAQGAFFYSKQVVLQKPTEKTIETVFYVIFFQNLFTVPIYKALQQSERICRNPSLQVYFCSIFQSRRSQRSPKPNG